MSERDSQAPVKTGTRVALQNLTDKEGPLYLLVKEVRDSNAMARTNVRLQRWSLVMLGLGMLFMMFLTAIILMVVGVFFDTKVTLDELVTYAEEEKASQPEIVVDEDTGEVSLVAPIKEPDEEKAKDKAEVEPEPEPETKLMSAPEPQPKKVARKLKPVPVPVAEPKPAPPPTEQHPIAEMLGKRSEPSPSAKPAAKKKKRVSVRVGRTDF